MQFFYTFYTFLKEYSFCFHATPDAQFLLAFGVLLSINSRLLHAHPSYHDDTHFVDETVSAV